MGGGNKKISSAHSNSNNKKKMKKKKMSAEQNLAAKSVKEWVLVDPPSPSTSDFQVPKSLSFSEPVVFELHSHSICSDGFLSPSALVERAHRNGVEGIEPMTTNIIQKLLSGAVKVLALTDHDTMAGIPEALKAARKFGIRIIPGVEISSIFSPRGETGTGEPVHILAYYGSCGPARFEDLENCLANIRDGRYVRAKDMLSKLNNLKKPLKWEHVARIAGNGVAPGRLHVARAMVEAGHVENLKQAFSRYLYDGGPAYATGSEPLAEEVVQLICQTGGVAALAHPWTLKNPVAVIRSLTAAGLHAMEVYRSDGKVVGFSDLADAYELVKLGGSDFHGRGGQDESDLGRVNLPVLAIHKFLKLARPIWCNAVKEILSVFAEEPSDLNLERIVRFGKFKNLKGDDMSLNDRRDLIELCLSSWLTAEERKTVELETLGSKLSHIIISSR